MRWLPFVLLAAVSMVAAQEDSKRPAQADISAKPSRQITGRFEFEVVESYDAKYLGDTPGHMGRHGELGDFRPLAALGDPVHRGDDIVGRITGLKWNRGTGSLDIEFDPEPLTTIYVGDLVWIKLGRKGEKRDDGKD